MDTKENLKKNQPNKIIPIMNSCFTLIFIAIAIYMKIKGNIDNTIFILGMVLFILFPITSWYNQYFLKKKNTKKIYNYEKETKEIVAYVKRLHKFQNIETKKDNKIKFKYELSDEIIAKTPVFDKEHSSLGLPREDAIIITFGVTFTGLEFKGYNQEFNGVVGLLPRSVWYRRKLKVPTAKKGKISIKSEGFELKPMMVIQTLKQSDTYYDNKTGWVLVGDKKPTEADEVIEVMNNVYVVIRFEELVGVWIKLEPNLAI